MEIERKEDHDGRSVVELTDQTGTDISLWVRENHKQGKGIKQLFFDFETDYVEFAQDQIKALLPYLQSFAETGTLEPQSSLQGEKIKIVANDSAKRVLEVVEMQKERIQALEQLVRDWHSLFEVVSNSTFQLLGEE